MELTIFIDRIKDQPVFFCQTLPSSLLETYDLTFDPSFSVEGQAYLTEDHLIVKIKEAKAFVYIPCSICNEPVKVPLTLSNFTHAESLDEIKGSFSVVSLVREELLLKVPKFAECNDSCPERKTLTNYLKKNTPHHQLPFADL